MIEILTAPDHVVAFRFAGEVTKDDYDTIIPAIEARLESHDKIGVFADLSDLDKITAPAILKDTAYSLSKLGDWKRFSRAAIVADQGWVENLAGVSDTLIPGIEVETFDPSAAEAAMAWASRPSAD